MRFEEREEKEENVGVSLEKLKTDHVITKHVSYHSLVHSVVQSTGVQGRYSQDLEP